MGTRRDRRSWPRIARDWLPFASILAAYRVLHQFSEPLSARAHVEPQRAIDEWAFGGTVPTVTLQRALWQPDDPRLRDYAAWLVYLSHFVVTPSIAGALWARDDPSFRRYRTLVLAGAYAGFLTYAAYPAIPPWLASIRGDLPPTDRVVQAIWAHLGAERVAAIFGEDSDLAFPVGALPSLHAAAPFLALLFFWDRAPRSRPLLVTYNIAMAGTLVYTADHFVFDIALGWAYAGGVYAAVTRWTRGSRAVSRAARGGGRRRP